MSSIRMVPVLLAGLALWQWQVRRRQRHQRKLSGTSVKSIEASIWEGEGGALHDARSPPQSTPTESS